MKSVSWRRYHLLPTKPSKHVVMMAASVVLVIITIISIAVGIRVISVLQFIRQTRLRRCRRHRHHGRDDSAATATNHDMNDNNCVNTNNNVEDQYNEDGTTNEKFRTHDSDFNNNSSSNNEDDDTTNNQDERVDVNLTNISNRSRRRIPATASSSSSISLQSTRTMVILGSGGHTTEMLLLLRSLDPVSNTYDGNDYMNDVVFVIANSDTTSLSKLLTTMKEMENQEDKKWEDAVTKDTKDVTSEAAKLQTKQKRTFEVRHLPRARELHQSYLSSMFTTLYAFYQSILLLWDTKPQLILANGPGTCIPIVYGAFALFRIFPCWWWWGRSRHHRHYFHDHYCKIVYVESVCRVRTLSLSGKLAYPIVDSFVVHWPKLVEQYDMVELCDALVPCSY